ncbi:hypothetical protein TNCV_3368751 [Trichonephila clavipes]|nr:hypothetical protein TNCV_3368751 [Trichonephila clavipes]
MESMLRIIKKFLKYADLNKVTKAELLEQYLKKTGITKLSKEDKKLFSSAVDTAYLYRVSPEREVVDSSDEINVVDNSDDDSRMRFLQNQ